MTSEEKSKIATCQICMLAANMRDCKLCKFNLGLLFKGFTIIKQAEVSTVSTNQGKEIVK